MVYWCFTWLREIKLGENWVYWFSEFEISKSECFISYSRRENVRWPENWKYLGITWKRQSKMFTQRKGAKRKKMKSTPHRPSAAPPSGDLTYHTTLTWPWWRGTDSGSSAAGSAVTVDSQSERPHRAGGQWARGLATQAANQRSERARHTANQRSEMVRWAANHALRRWSESCWIYTFIL